MTKNQPRRLINFSDTFEGNSASATTITCFAQAGGFKTANI